MSRLVFAEQASTPPTPSAGKVRVYINSGGTLASVDDTGTVTTYSSGITQEQVEDIVGNLLQDTSTVNVTYNDAGNVVSFDVIPGGISHNSLADLTTGNPHTQYLQTSVAATTYQPLDSDLTAVAGLAGTGLVTRTGSGAMTTRTVVNGGGTTVLNGDGVSGNPSVSINFDSSTLDVTNVTGLITVDLQSGVGGSFNNAAQTPVLTVDTYGRTVAISGQPIAITGGQVSNTPAGNIAATTVQAAINELDSEKQPIDADLTAFAGLTGSGLVVRTGAGTATTRTIAAGTGISVSNGDGVSGNPTISSSITQYTDELAQDAVGGILTDTASVDFTYNDAANQITATVLPAGVNHDALQNFVANEHIDHSAVSISAGTGLSGGGDITTNRTLNIANTGVTATSYGSTTAIPVLTINAQGQITAASTALVTSSQWVDAGGFLTWSDDGGKNLVVRQANNTGSESALIEQVKSRGTIASPSALLSGDKIGGNAFYGWNSGGKNTALSEVNANATENHTPTAQGTDLRFSTTPNGTTATAERAVIQQDGNWDLKSNRITNAANPVNAQDYVTKAYVDNGGSWQEYVNTAALTNNSNVTTTQVPNLQINVVAGRNYRIEAHMRFRSAAAATGIGVTINSSDGATGTIAGSADIPLAGDGTGAIYSGAITTLGDLVVATAVPAANTDYLAVLAVQFTCTGSGTVAPFFRSETNGTTVTVQVGSNIIAREWA